ncbi:HD superfamily phosphohydrolase [Natronocella acetinitrilica]|uniref:HD superfamily phosphohydrolase n=1 Tax=Natronocella acetinitrilica TaxID=414046 RepID=A0AAE3G1T9_9GAMM|nr:HD domain-containing protein [Natronocella acetinitrilica]MCP1674161.1 HD superfamily phosphohydrolase [Natronocella acetinitrilica]
MSIELAHNTSVMDTVHGAIALLDHEKSVIDHPLFQRLRHIAQNDVLFLVFPGATHSRFAHSIGVMHVAQRMFHAMLDAARYERKRLGLGEPGDAASAGVAYLASVLRLAALLHDTGHGAFSHQMESAPAIRAMIDAEGQFERLWAGVDVGGFYSQAPTHLEHEHYSIRSAHAILSERLPAGSESMVQDVLNVMETTDGGPSERFCAAASAAWGLIAPGTTAPEGAGALVMGLLGDIISGELDADKGDYLLRDSRYTGVAYGLYSLDNLANNLRFGYQAQEQWLGIAVNRKGLPEFENFVLARFGMFRHVYAHKTAIGFEILLLRAINEVMEDASAAAQLSAMLSDIRHFAYLTDAFFWERFRARAMVDPVSASARLLARDKLPFLGGANALDLAAKRKAAAAIAESTGVRLGDIQYRCSLARFSAIGEDYRAIRVLVKGPGGERAYRPLVAESDFFGRFESVERTNFYLDPPSAA